MTSGTRPIMSSHCSADHVQPLQCLIRAMRCDQVDVPVVEQLGHAAQNCTFVVNQYDQRVGRNGAGRDGGDGRLNQQGIAAGHIDAEHRSVLGT